MVNDDNELVKRINPPIRGSIGDIKTNRSSYRLARINPPIRGSIDVPITSIASKSSISKRTYQSPYTGFNRYLEVYYERRKDRINPPIRGSIERT